VIAHKAVGKKAYKSNLCKQTPLEKEVNSSKAVLRPSAATTGTVLRFLVMMQ